MFFWVPRTLRLYSVFCFEVFFVQNGAPVRLLLRSFISGGCPPFFLIRALGRLMMRRFLPVQCDGLIHSVDVQRVPLHGPDIVSVPSGALIALLAEPHWRGVEPSAAAVVPL